MIAILLILVFIAGAANAVMDTVKDHFDKSIFNRPKLKHWWDERMACENKYNEDGTRKKWLGFIAVPVLFTSAWHLFKSFFLDFIFIAMVFYQPISYSLGIGNWYMLADYIALRAAFGFGFVLFYNFILVKK